MIWRMIMMDRDGEGDRGRGGEPGIKSEQKIKKERKKDEGRWGLGKEMTGSMIERVRELERESGKCKGGI